jgi:hypothetical protein
MTKRDKEKGDEVVFSEVVGFIRKSAPGRKPRVGTLMKETAAGDFAEAFRSALPMDELEEVDVSQGLGLVLAVKDEVGWCWVSQAPVAIRGVMSLSPVSRLPHGVWNILPSSRARFSRRWPLPRSSKSSMTKSIPLSPMRASQKSWRVPSRTRPNFSIKRARYFLLHQRVTAYALDGSGE